VALITGALPAQYGLRTAGIIDIQTKTGTLSPGGSVTRTSYRSTNGIQTTDQPISIFDSASKTGWIYSYYLQDEWKIIASVTVNFGAPYDQFPEFVSERQLSPRVNVVWQPTIRRH
jgi:outer membrane receptor for ferrienterochelin and colicin